MAIGLEREVNIPVISPNLKVISPDDIEEPKKAAEKIYPTRISGWDKALLSLVGIGGAIAFYFALKHDLKMPKNYSSVITPPLASRLEEELTRYQRIGKTTMLLNDVSRVSDNCYKIKSNGVVQIYEFDIQNKMMMIHQLREKTTDQSY